MAEVRSIILAVMLFLPIRWASFLPKPQHQRVQYALPFQIFAEGFALPLTDKNLFGRLNIDRKIALRSLTREYRS
ncbi:MAG: hypothetical protein B7Y89_16985 [Novosphingobium sp. 32-60-15]|nr:MAG: hypothetical protein B7Y89_16985 [Novosphingobium sp. 32-60-15]